MADYLTANASDDPSEDDFTEISHRELLAIIDTADFYSDMVIEAAEDEMERRGGRACVLEGLELEEGAGAPDLPPEWNGMTAKQIRYGFYWGMAAACILSGLLLIPIIFNIAALLSPVTVLFYLPLALIALTSLALGIGVLQKKRYCAFGLLAVVSLVLLTMIVRATSDGNWTGEIIMALPLYGAICSVRSVLRWRQIELENEDFETMIERPG
ncbi:MAG: hypothetical protein ABIQ57_06090 [Candidatus Kapaibacterium sp.]